jgi:3'(2'),5'-bisphosphate nucleotidase
MSAMLETMIAATIEAAKVIEAIYRWPIEVTDKPDGSPLTMADAAAEVVIVEKLAATGIPVLAEESAAAGRIPKLGERFFAVDPLDGTKEFIKRNGEFTVNIALIEKTRPVLGVVLAPATGALYAGGPDGAFFAEVTDGVLGARRRISVDEAAPMRVVASRSHGHQALADLCEAMAVSEDVSVGSSLKFCLLAEGKARLYPRFTPTSEWDTAAGQAVLEAAGGAVLTLDGAALGYGKAANGFLNPFFVAASGPDLARKAAMHMTKLETFAAAR